MPRFFEIALVLVRFDQVARFVVNANRGFVNLSEKRHARQPAASNRIVLAKTAVRARASPSTSLIEPADRAGGLSREILRGEGVRASA
jgi:hypothetical protein